MRDRSRLEVVAHLRHCSRCSKRQQHQRLARDLSSPSPCVRSCMCPGVLSAVRSDRTLCRPTWFKSFSTHITAARRSFAHGANGLAVTGSGGTCTRSNTGTRSVGQSKALERRECSSTQSQEDDTARVDASTSTHVGIASLRVHNPSRVVHTSSKYHTIVYLIARSMISYYSRKYLIYDDGPCDTCATNASARH